MKTVMGLDKYYIKGTVVNVNGQYFKITKELGRFGEGGKLHEVIPATEAQYRSRVGKVKISEPTINNDVVGSIISKDGEFLHVEKVERVTDQHGEGWHSYAVGHYVPSAKAAMLQAAWEKRMEPAKAQRDLMRSQLDK
jgi:hypothetical protein